MTSKVQPAAQPRSQGLSSLPSLVIGTETLVEAGHVTIYPFKTAGWVGTQVHLVERTIKYPFQQIFLPPRFCVVTWPVATRVSVPTTKGGREERPWERGCPLQIIKPMTSKVQPAGGYRIVDRKNTGDEIVLFLLARKWVRVGLEVWPQKILPRYLMIKTVRIL